MSAAHYLPNCIAVIIVMNFVIYSPNSQDSSSPQKTVLEAFQLSYILMIVLLFESRKQRHRKTFFSNSHLRKSRTHDGVTDVGDGFPPL